MKTCPFHPSPSKSKLGTLLTLLIKRRSWLDGLYDKSYKMKMGEVKMPGFNLHVINSPELVREVMIENVDNFPKSSVLHELLEPLLGISIFTTNGEVWRRQRELLRPSFELTRISKVFDLMSEAAEDLMIKLRENQGKFINADEFMTFVTADVIFRTIMSAKLNEESGKKVLDAFIIFQEQTAKTAMRQFFKFPAWLSLILGEKKRQKAGRVIKQTLSDIIKPRYESYKKTGMCESEDILATLLATKDENGKEFSFEEILDQVSMLFLAGHETTASSLTWTLYCLSLDGEAQKKAFEEIAKIQPKGKFEIENIRNLKFLTNCFLEALRLYPPVGFFARTALNDTKMRNKLIKKDDGVVVAPWLIHRHEEYWENPHEFRPERHESQLEKEKFMPFGLGRRVCIGKGFAMQEAIIILANILREFELVLEPDFVPDVVGRLTIRSANGMRIKFKSRAN